MAEKREPGSLGQAIREVLRQAELEGKAREYAAITRWAEVVGEANARHSQAERVVKGVLWVRTEDPAWSQVLQMMKPQIMARLAEVVGVGVIRDVRFEGARRRRATTPAPAAPPLPLRGPSRQELEAIRLTGKERERQRAWQTETEDPELGQMLAAGYASLTRLRRYREAQGWRRCPRCGRPQWGPGRWCVLCMGAGGR